MSDEHPKPDDKAIDLPASSFLGLVQSLIKQGVLSPPSHPGVMAQLDRFEILRLVGAGGMGIVLLARDTNTSARVAIKLLKPEYLNDARTVHRFLLEAQRMKHLQHPHLLSALEVSDRANGLYFV